MLRLPSFFLVLVSLGSGVLACAPPEPLAGISRSKDRTAKADKEDDPEDSEGAEDEAATSTKPTSKMTPSPPSSSGEPAPAIELSFAAQAGAVFNGTPVARICSHTGAELTQATLLDATGLSIVKASAPGKVLVTLEGPAFLEVKNELMTTGKLRIEVDPTLLPREGEDYEYAIIARGDDRFGSPSTCGVSSLKPNDKQRDVETFPTSPQIVRRRVVAPGCAVIGFFETFYNEATETVYSRPSSQLLIAAWEEPRGGFTTNKSLQGCDGKDSPLVLDLGGSGVSLSGPRRAIFDVDGDGRPDDSPWVSSDDTPFLVRDANRNGVIDGVDEMFGNRTHGPRGGANANNGFEALAEWDDGDGVIDGRDKVWSSLRLWFDRNHDGQTDEGELETLPSRGVRAISLGYVSVSENLFAGGALQGAVRQRGGATMTDGRIAPLVDVWFERRF